jgi:hypothetical protein
MIHPPLVANSSIFNAAGASCPSPMEMLTNMPLAYRGRKKKKKNISDRYNHAHSKKNNRKGKKY